VAADAGRPSAWFSVAFDPARLHSALDEEMNLPTFALFESSLPDDSVEEGGDIKVPAGRNVMESLAQRLKESGVQASPVSQHSFYGWSFDARIGNRKFWFLIQGGLPWVLIVRDRRSMILRLTEGSAPVRAALEACDAALQTLGHVSALEWLTRTAYEARGRAEYERRKKTPN
jgi:hypothetical protein